MMDELGRRVVDKASTELRPELDTVSGDQWAKLAFCIVMDIAGDASELIPFLGEFTDVGFAPIEVSDALKT